MKLQRQPSRWSCFPTSLAMCLDVPVQRIFDVIGHDGSEILWPDLPEPQKRKAFSFGEITLAAYQFGYGVLLFEKEFYIFYEDGQEHSFPTPSNYIESKMSKFSGILTGTTMRGKRHAVAWDGRKIFDPNETVYSVDKFNIEGFWALVDAKPAHPHRSVHQKIRSPLQVPR